MRAGSSQYFAVFPHAVVAGIALGGAEMRVSARLEGVDVHGTHGFGLLRIRGGGITTTAAE